MGLFDWIKKEKKAKKQEKKQDGGPFASSILLSQAAFSLEKFISDLKNDWNIDISDEVSSDDKETLVCTIDGMTAAVSLMPGPVPDDEAVNNAKTNYRWPEAVSVAQEHKAHLLVAILPNEQSLSKAGILLVKLSCCGLKQENATGIYTAGSVFAPDFYINHAEVYLHEDLYPVMNLVFFGLYSRDNGKTFCSYTYGMDVFCKDEFEVIDSKHSPQELIDFMSDIAAYVIEGNVLLQDGETIGFSEEQKLPITKSRSDVLDGYTLKIEF